MHGAQAASGKLTLCGCVTEKQSWRKAFENEVPNSSVCNYSTSVYDWGGLSYSTCRNIRESSAKSPESIRIWRWIRSRSLESTVIRGSSNPPETSVSRETSVEQIGPRRRTRIQRTRLISTHAIRGTALLPILPNLKRDASIFCWSNSPSLSFTAALLSLVRRPRVSRPEKQIEADCQRAA